jgi:hypothetical protein
MLFCVAGCAEKYTLSITTYYSNASKWQGVIGGLFYNDSGCKSIEIAKGDSAELWQLQDGNRFFVSIRNNRYLINEFDNTAETDSAFDTLRLAAK